MWGTVGQGRGAAQSWAQGWSKTWGKTCGDCNAECNYVCATSGRQGGCLECCVLYGSVCSVPQTHAMRTLCDGVALCGTSRSVIYRCDPGRVRGAQPLRLSARALRRNISFIHTFQTRLPGWEATHLAGWRRFDPSLGPQAVRRLHRLPEVRCWLQSLEPIALAACVPLLRARLSEALVP